MKRSAIAAAVFAALVLTALPALAGSASNWPDPKTIVRDSVIVGDGVRTWTHNTGIAWGCFAPDEGVLIRADDKGWTEGTGGYIADSRVQAVATHPSGFDYTVDTGIVSVLRMGSTSAVTKWRKGAHWQFQPGHIISTNAANELAIEVVVRVLPENIFEVQSTDKVTKVRGRAYIKCKKP